MADKFKLNIISPEKKFLEGDCEFLECDPYPVT